MKQSSVLTLLLCVLTLLGASGAASAHASGSAESFEEALAPLYEDADNIVSQERVLELIQDGAIGSQVYLLDIRSEPEWEVSHLQGARFVGYRGFSLDDIEDIPRDARIILYCAVGWRSGRVGRIMRRAGYTDVSNMYGGILYWADQGRPMVDDDGPTHRVHGRQPRWGRWVENPDVEVVY